MFPEDEAKKFLVDIVLGLKELHDLRIMHRDLKLANLMLHNGSVKIVDLGFAKECPNEH